MTNFSLDEQVADAESLQKYRYLVWMEFDSLRKEQNPVRRANKALSLAEHTATLAHLEAEEAHTKLKIDRNRCHSKSHRMGDLGGEDLSHLQINSISET